MPYPPRRSLPRPLVALILLLTTAITLPVRAADPVAALPGYESYPAFTQHVAALADDPHIISTALAKTRAGRDVLLLTIADNPAQATDHPAILIVGSVDADHLAGSEIAVRLVKKLAADTDLLKRFTFYVIPRPSPDASEAMFTAPLNQSPLNTRPTDDDRDAAVDEDGPDDLNHDGLITQMRIEDPTGDWIVSPDDPRLMIRADASKGEVGRYRIEIEGLDDDHDELYNEDGPGGVDFDRNFTFEYPYFKPGAGPHQVSEPETRAVADFAFSHLNIAAVLAFTTCDNLMHPWSPGQGSNGRIKTDVLGEDAPLMQHVAEQYQKLIGEKNAPPPTSRQGAFTPWGYFHFGRWSFGTPGWWVPKVEPKDKPKDGRDATSLNTLRWLDQQKIDGFAKWTVVKDPDFPGKKVEVGGFKPFVTINPPAKLLDDLADRHFKFVQDLAGMMPKIRIDSVKVDALGANVYRITATAINDGYLPTVSKMGQINRQLQPLQWRLTDLAKDALILQSFARVQTGPIAGSGGHAEQSWLIRTGAGHLTVEIDSPSVGSASREVKLK